MAIKYLDATHVNWASKRRVIAAEVTPSCAVPINYRSPFAKYR